MSNWWVYGQSASLYTYKNIFSLSLLQNNVSIMLSQVASLLHDDVLDDADTRRGIGSLNFVMGNKVYLKLCFICLHNILHLFIIVWLYLLNTYCHMVGVPCLRFLFFSLKNAVGSVGWRFFAFSGLCCSRLFEKYRGKVMLGNQHSHK